MSRIANWGSEGSKLEVNFENIVQYGVRAFDEKEVFRLCTKRIREDSYEEDDFMLYLSFEMFKRQQYDKVTLTYLANYYCGSTRSMKALWKVAKEYELPVTKLGERIITQMLFSEVMFGEEEIFVDYYVNGNPYFRLKQAYLAFVCKEYVVYGREMGRSIFEVLLNEEHREEELADICKIALLQYYAEREIPPEAEEILHRLLREMCEKQIIFPFYLNYKESWLREVQLYDRAMISYQASPGGKVKLIYKMRRGELEDLGYQTESLTPMYENIYVKDFILFGDEHVRYSFHESNDRIKKAHTEPEQILKQERKITATGKYGKLNAMAFMGPAERKRAMMEYEQELYFADKMFREYNRRV